MEYPPLVSCPNWVSSNRDGDSNPGGSNFRLVSQLARELWFPFEENAATGLALLAATFRREAASIAIKITSVKIVNADSFARIFYCNVINVVGLRAMESPVASPASDAPMRSA
jgi:hypothetical protein